MSQDAILVFDQIERDEIVIRHVPIQEMAQKICEPAAPKESSTDLSGQSAAQLISHLILRMQELGSHFNETVNAATKDLIHRVDASVVSVAPSNSISTTRLKIMTAQNEFLGKILDASRQINSQRQSLIDEIQTLGCENRGSLVDEIVKTESAVRAEERNIQEMIEDHSMDLTSVIRANAAHNAMKAYLKGLKFQATDASE